MQRRTLLARAATIAPLVGAGCLGGDGGGGSVDCRAPSTDDLRSLLPEGDAFRLHEDEMFMSGNTTAETGGTKAYLLAEVETGGQTHWVSISRFPSAANATREMNAFLEEDSPGYGGVAYVRTGRYLFGAGGADEETVGQLLSATGPLNRSCVEANAQWQ